jgi:phospholipid/cholesterol/gamma-HCH transport system permease protein
MYVSGSVRDGVLHLALAGDWRARDVPAIEAELAGLSWQGLASIELDPSGLGALDLSGAWLLHDFGQRAARSGAVVSYPGGIPEPVRLVDRTLQDAAGAGAAAGEGARDGAGALRGRVTALGQRVVDRLRGGRRALEFVGESTLRFLAAVVQPRRWRPISVARHVYDTGITAIPIVALIAFLISVIIAYMGAQQLQKFGADIFVVDLVTVGVLREMGVLLTAIIVAGRSGSAFAAEIGAMQLNEEVDALKAIGVVPNEVLVLPRVLGLVVALPLLTVIANGVGLAGGALLCSFLLDMPLVQYIQRMQEAIGPWTFWVGIIKAPVFALLIAAAGTYCGMQVRGSSRELGRLTTVAVVMAIFLVILADALFAVLFMEIGI